MLKRILPFVLTLLAGIALWGAINFYGARKNNLAPTGNTLNNKRDCILFNHQLSALKGEAEATTECSIRARGSFADVVKRLKIINKPEAQYTQAARRNETAGTVRLRVEFGADGRVTDVQPLVTLPDGLTEEAAKAARKIEFIPEMVNGVPMSVKKTVEYNFSLH